MKIPTIKRVKIYDKNKDVIHAILLNGKKIGEMRKEVKWITVGTSRIATRLANRYSLIWEQQELRKLGITNLTNDYNMTSQYKFEEVKDMILKRNNTFGGVF